MNLLPSRGAYVGCTYLCAEPLRRGDCLQTGHPYTHYENLGRLDGTGSGHHHRKGTAIGIRGSKHGLVSGEVRLARQYVHALRTRDARHEFHAQGFQPRRRIGRNQLAITERIERRCNPRAGFRTRQLSRIGGLNAEDDIGPADNIGRGADFGPRLAIRIVGDRGAEPGTLFDCDRGPERSELLRRFGCQRHPAFTGSAFFHHRDA